MEIEDEIIKKRELQNLVLDFIENDSDDDENFKSLIKFITNNDISKNKIDLKDLLHIILKISNNHQRNKDFFTKIISIIKYLLPNIQSFFSNLYIHNIFRENALLILYFIRNEIIELDKDIMDQYRSFPLFNSESIFDDCKFKRKISYKQAIFPYKYLFSYLYFQSLNDQKQQKLTEQRIEKIFGLDIETFQEYCLHGENESQIAQLIRQDALDEFISYVNTNDCELDSNINFSNFETNVFLLSNNTKLIEYAAFFGSVQIFKYLQKNNVTMNPILIEFAVHGQNPEIIHLVEEKINDFKAENPIKRTYSFQSENMDVFDPMKALIESIKCFHIDIARYFEENYYDDIENDFKKYVFKEGLYCYNYQYVPLDFDTLFSFLSEYLSDIRMRTNGETKIYNIYEKLFLLPKITFISETTKAISICSFTEFKLLKEVVLSSSITSIEHGSFEGCSSLIKITIPASVTEIGCKAFSYCTSLKEISIPSSITEIKSSTFNKCSSLTKITIPSSVTKICDNAFSECSALTQIDLPSSLISIGNDCFFKCISLKQILIPISAIEIENSSGIFCECSSLEEITIPPSLHKIPKYMFTKCHSLKQINLHSSITSIEKYAFSECSSLKQIKIPSSVTLIGKYAFNKCVSLSQIDISSITQIDKYCFKDCSSLKKILIPNSITCIKIGTFVGCSSLEEIEIPSSVKEIEEFAFSECSSLKQIRIHSNITSIRYGVFNECSSLVNFDFPTSITEIKECAFKGCKSLSNVLIPSCITSIKDSCFERCLSLNEIMIPHSVTSIGDYVFKDCLNLTKITIPSSVTFIGESVFMNCSSLKEISFPASTSLEKFDDHCFDGCSSLEEIILPSSLKILGEYTFKNCTSLKSIKIPSNVFLIGRNCFEGCTSLLHITLSSCLTILNEYLFKDCTSILQFTIPSSVFHIKYGIFKGCSSLIEVQVPKSIQIIEDNVFNSCKSLKKILIPCNISKISDFMFFNCSELSEIVFTSQISEIGDFAFYGCSSLSKLIIPSSVKKIGDFAFNGCTLLPTNTFSTHSFGEFLTNQYNKVLNIFGKAFNSKEITEIVNTNVKIELEPKIILKKQIIDENIQNYLKNRKEIYQYLLNYLEYPEIDKEDENLSNLIQFFNEKNMPEDENDLIELLNLLSNISLNHHRSVNFISRILKILNIYKEEIKQKLSNIKIFQIFKNNKIILPHLIDKDFIRIDQTVFDNINNNRIKLSDNYYMPEILKAKNDEESKQYSKNNKINIDLFKEIRKIGENESIICNIIRKDDLNDFIQFLKDKIKNKANNAKGISISLFDSVNRSIFETHPYLIKTLHDLSYIEYAAFFGSLKIFNYLFDKLYDTNIEESLYQDLYKVAINGNNWIIIQLIERKNIKPKNIEHSDEKLNHLDIAIKCHHNEIAKYIKNNHHLTTDGFAAFKSFNYLFIDDFYNNFCNNDCLLLYYLCKYDYPKFAQVLINSKNIDINQYSNQKEIEDHYYSNTKKASDKDIIINTSIKKNTNLVKFLMEKRKMKIEFIGKSLIEAIYNEDIELIRIILSQSNININVHEYKKFKIGDEECDEASPLILAIAKRNQKIINILLKYPLIDPNLKYCPNNQRWTKKNALHIAILLEDITIIKSLLNRPDINVNSLTSFDQTTFRFHEWSTSYQFDLYFRPLHVAIELGNIEIVSLLLKHPKILVNEQEAFDVCKTRVRQTALCRAIQKKDVKIVELLLEHPNIDLNKPAVFVPNKSNDNYKFNEALYYNKEIVDVNSNNVDENGNIKKTPIQFAYANKSHDIIQLLLNRSDIDKTNNIDENESSVGMFTQYINKDWK